MSDETIRFIVENVTMGVITVAFLYFITRSLGD